jgi:hypothetical protein
MVSSHEGTIGSADCGVSVRDSEPCKTVSGGIVGVFEAELVGKTIRISHGKRRRG